MIYSASPVRPDLGPVALSYDASTQGFVADQVLPRYDVDSRVGELEKIGVEVMTQLEHNIERESGAKFKRVGYGKTKDVYACVEYGLEGVVDHIDEMTAEREARETQRTALRLMRMVDLEREYRVVQASILHTDYAHGSGFGTNVSATWATTGTPLSDVRFARNQIRNACGLYPNRILLTDQQIFELSMNTEVTARLNTSRDNEGEIDLGRLAQIIGVEKIIKPFAPYNTAPNGAAASISSLWSDSKVLLWHAREDDNFEDIQFGRTLSFDENMGGGLGTTVEFEDYPRYRSYAHYQTVQEKRHTRGAAYVLHNV